MSAVAGKLRRAKALLLALSLASGGCGGSGVPIESEPPPADQVSLARIAFEKKNFTESEGLLKGYLDYNPAGLDAGEAHFLLGMIYYRRKEWPSAATEYSIVVNQFGADDRVPDARYHLGLSYWKQSRPAPYDQEYTLRALTEFDRFLSLYPDHPRAEEVLEARNEARGRLARKAYDNGKLYLKLGYYEPARYYFRLVQREYPDTSLSFEAAVGEAKTWVKQREWERAQDILIRLLDQSPPDRIGGQARRLLDEVERVMEHEKQG
jgi:outer membrane protein assembly factor BamD